MYQMAKRERRQPLQVVVAEHLLPVDVHGLAQLSQLGERLHIVEDGALRVHRPADADVGEERRFPVAVLGLLGPVAPTKASAVTASRRRERAVAHQPTEQHLPLKLREAVLDGLEHPITDEKLARLTPPTGSADLVVRRAPELGTAIACPFGATVNCRK